MTTKTIAVALRRPLTGAWIETSPIASRIERWVSPPHGGVD